MFGLFSQDHDFDFALVKLSSPVELNDHVAPVCFPSESLKLDDVFGPRSTCAVTGWGSTSTEFFREEASPVLKKDNTQLFSLQKCKELFLDLKYPVEVTDRMLCAGNYMLIKCCLFQMIIIGHRKTLLEDPKKCNNLGKGDSGGPLVCQNGDRWYHLGAASWRSPNCEVDQFTPTVFASTINMREWIIETLQNNTSVMEDFVNLLINDS